MGKSEAVFKDISRCFHLEIAIHTLDVLCREKLLSILSNRSMVKNGSSYSNI